MFEDPVMYSGKVNGLRSNVTSYGVLPIPVFHEVL